MKVPLTAPPPCLLRASDTVQPWLHLLFLLLLLCQPMSLFSQSSSQPSFDDLNLNASLLLHAPASISSDSLHLEPEAEPSAADMTQPADVSLSAPASQTLNSPSASPSYSPPSSSSSSLYSRYLLPAVAAALLSSVSAVCYLYYRYRHRSAASSFPPSDFHSRPLLLQVRQGSAASRVQGLDWAVQSLQWDADGDCAHEFLGPFSFAADSDTARTAAAAAGQPETAEKEAATLSATGARKAPAVTTAGRKGLRSRRKA
jgi:hypothetical protein